MGGIRKLFSSIEKRDYSKSLLKFLKAVKEELGLLSKRRLLFRKRQRNLKVRGSIL